MDVYDDIDLDSDFKIKKIDHEEFDQKGKGFGYVDLKNLLDPDFVNHNTDMSIPSKYDLY